MKLIENLIFSLFLLFLIWYLFEKVTGFHVSGAIPLLPIAILLWGVGILVSYFAKSEMYIARGWRAPAGELNIPARWLGAVFGVVICAFALYEYFSGWKS